MVMPPRSIQGQDIGRGKGQPKGGAAIATAPPDAPMHRSPTVNATELTLRGRVHPVLAQKPA